MKTLKDKVEICEDLPNMYFEDDVKEAVLKYRTEYIEKGIVSIEAFDLIFGEFN